MKYAFPTDDNEVARKYTTGDKSIMRSLPIPTPLVRPYGAVIPVKLQFNHIVALDLPFKCCNTDADWTDDYGNYDGEFYRSWHEKIKKMKNEGRIPKGTRIVFIRVWADGFQAFMISGHNEYNSIQLYTLTVVAPRGEQTKHHTLPFALCFKKEVDSDIFCSLITECNNLLDVREVYFGRDNKVFPTMAILDVVQNDMPERCDNTKVCYKGKYTARFGFSWDASIPSKSICNHCEYKTIQIHLKKKFDKVWDCKDCTCWGSVSRITQTPFIDQDVESVAGSDHIAKLSFEQLQDAAEKAQSYADDTGFKDLNRSDSSKVRETLGQHLHKSGFPRTLNETLVGAMKNGINVIEAGLLPKIWKLCVEFGISLDQFPCIPMHLLFLGIEKNLLKQTSDVYDRKSSANERNCWTDLTNHMGRVQKAVSDLSLGWCVTMPFSGDLKVGSSGWESGHYVAFSRVSLVFFAQLHGADHSATGSTSRVLLAFKSVRVVWFCLISRLMADDKVNSEEVDSYVKLFLSACKRLHECVEDRSEEKEEESRKKAAMRAAKASSNNSKKRKKSNQNNDQPTSKKRK